MARAAGLLCARGQVSVEPAADELVRRARRERAGLGCELVFTIQVHNRRLP